MTVTSQARSQPVCHWCGRRVPLTSSGRPYWRAWHDGARSFEDRWIVCGDDCAHRPGNATVEYVVPWGAA